MASALQNQTFKFQHALDALFHRTSQLLALGILATVVLIAVLLFHSSLPSLTQFGLNFLTSAEWDPVAERMGGLGPIVGTLVTALLSVAIAIPVSFGIALFITEICPNCLRRILRVLIELLAGIPSIIYGMWGLFILAPVLADPVQPWLIAHFFPNDTPLGIGVMTAAIVLSIMIIPFMASVIQDGFALVPDLLKESAYALGATRWEVIRNVILPYCKSSAIGGVILGLGRALGETMAVAFVIGNSHELFKSLIAPGSTISSVLANEFSEATGKLYSSALSELGLILLGITLLVFLSSKLLFARSRG